MYICKQTHFAIIIYYIIYNVLSLCSTKWSTRQMCLCIYIFPIKFNFKKCM